jgi:hypothetical protein
MAKAFHRRLFYLSALPSIGFHLAKKSSDNRIKNMQGLKKYKPPKYRL